MLMLLLDYSEIPWWWRFKENNKNQPFHFLLHGDKVEMIIKPFFRKQIRRCQSYSGWLGLYRRTEEPLLLSSGCRTTSAKQRGVQGYQVWDVNDSWQHALCRLPWQGTEGYVSGNLESNILNTQKKEVHLLMVWYLYIPLLFFCKLIFRLMIMNCWSFRTLFFLYEFD